VRRPGGGVLMAPCSARCEPAAQAEGEVMSNVSDQVSGQSPPAIRATVRIGNKTLVCNESLIVSDNQEARLEVQLPQGNRLSCLIVFLPPEESGTAGVRWRGEADNVLKIEFVGWTNPLGTAMQPTFLGDFQGEKINLAAAHWFVGSLNVLNFQLYFGGDR
jgi:hypothetical protein